MLASLRDGAGGPSDVCLAVDLGGRAEHQPPARLPGAAGGERGSQSGGAPRRLVAQVHLGGVAGDIGVCLANQRLELGHDLDRAARQADFLLGLAQRRGE